MKLVEENPVSGREVSIPLPLQIPKPSDTSSPDLIVICQIQFLQHLPRYHFLVEDFRAVADRWMAAGYLRGPANVGDGYLLELLIPLSGEEGDILLGQLDQEESSDEESLPSYRG